jgi:hypothetical protein
VCAALTALQGSVCINSGYREWSVWNRKELTCKTDQALLGSDTVWSRRWLQRFGGTYHLLLQGEPQILKTNLQSIGVHISTLANRNGITKTYLNLRWHLEHSTLVTRQQYDNEVAAVRSMFQDYACLKLSSLSRIWMTNTVQRVYTLIISQRNEHSLWLKEYGNAIEVDKETQ